MMPIPKTNSRHATLSLLSLAGGCVLLLGACDTKSEPRKTVDTAASRVKQTGLSSGVSTVEATADQLQKHAQPLQKLAGAGTPGEQSSAALLSAQAAQARGEVDAQKAAAADGVIRDKLSRMTGLASIWSLKNGVALGAESFDPTAQLDEIARNIAAKQTQIASENRTLEQINARLADLRGRADADEQAAQGLLAEAARLTERVSAVSARDAVPLMERSRELKRQADAKRMTSQQLQAQADQLAPQAAESKARLDQYTKQAAQFEQGAAAIRARQSEARKTAQEARAQADNAAGDLAQLVDDVIKGVGEDFKPALEQAGSSYAKAIASAKQAQAGNPSGDPTSAGKVAAGSANLSLAQLHLTATQTFAAVANTFEVVAATEPALPTQQKILAEAKLMREAARAARDDAKSALEAAQSAFSSAQLRGPAKERLQSLATLLEQAGKVVDGSATSLAHAASMQPKEENPETTPQAPPAEPEPQAAEVDPNAPDPAAVDLMRRAIQASKAGDWDALRAMYAAPQTDDGRALIDLGVRQSAIGKRINDACLDKFQLTFVDTLKQAKNANPMMLAQISQMSGGDLSTMDVSKMRFEKAQDGVTVTFPGSPLPIQLIQENGAWKFSGKQMDELGSMVGAMKPMVDAMLANLDAFAAKIEAGEFADAPAAGDALFDAIMQGMGGPGGG